MSGNDKRTVYSWDTCVFLALLKREADKPLADIVAVATDIELGKADFVVSTIVIAEMLDLIDDLSLAAEFNGFLQRPNVLVVNVDPQIARRTARLRSEWRASATPDEKRNIKTPDAIILATAMLAGASVLHTFEPKLQRLSKTELVEQLSITSPLLASGQKVFLSIEEQRNDEAINEPQKTPAEP